MPGEEFTNPAAVTRWRPGELDRPRWRSLLEDRWQARLHEVTELSLAYHAAEHPEPERLLQRAVAARRQLADVEEALARLADGTFGHCEQCRSAIPAGTLAITPEARYCPACAAGSVPPRPVLAAGRPVPG